MRHVRNTLAEIIAERGMPKEVAVKLIGYLSDEEIAELASTLIQQFAEKEASR